MSEENKTEDRELFEDAVAQQRRYNRLLLLSAADTAHSAALVLDLESMAPAHVAALLSAEKDLREVANLFI